VAVRGGSVDAVKRAHAKVAELEQERVTDKALFEKLENQIREDRLENQHILDQLHAKIQEMEKGLEECKQHGALIGVLTRKLKNWEEAVADSAQISVRKGMASLVDDCSVKIRNECRAEFARERALLQRVKTFGECEGSSCESAGGEIDAHEAELAVRRGKRAKVRRKKARDVSSYDFAPGFFGAMRSSFGIGLLMMLLLVLCQVAFASAGSLGSVGQSLPGSGRLVQGDLEFQEVAMEHEILGASDDVFIDSPGIVSSRKQVDLVLKHNDVFLYDNVLPTVYDDVSQGGCCDSKLPMAAVSDRLFHEGAAHGYLDSSGLGRPVKSASNDHAKSLRLRKRESKKVEKGDEQQKTRRGEEKRERAEGEGE
jgi:hypothetical protein